MKKINQGKKIKSYCHVSVENIRKSGQEGPSEKVTFKLNSER